MRAYVIGISVKFCCSLNVKERIADQINNQKVPKNCDSGFSFNMLFLS